MTDAEGSASTYQELIALLDEHAADYELLEHAPVGTTDVVSELRGNPLEQAAKCLMLVVKVDRHTRRYVLAVVPGDAKVDLGRVASRYAARYVGFCDPTTAERLARTVPGTVLPFAMDPSVELVVDPRVLAQPRLYFNAARLDLSVSLSTADYAAIAGPQVAEIAQREGSPA
jgi:Ala-tRNA(Pro) deacylase